MYTNFNFHPKANTPPQHVAIIPDGGDAGQGNMECRIKKRI